MKGPTTPAEMCADNLKTIVEGHFSKHDPTAGSPMTYVDADGGKTGANQVKRRKVPVHNYPNNPNVALMTAILASEAGVVAKTREATRNCEIENFVWLSKPMHNAFARCSEKRQLKMRVAWVLFLLSLVFVNVCWSISVFQSSALNQSVSNSEIELFNSSKPLSRKKRFLLFPPGSSLLVTASALKGLLFKGPGGNVLLAELDMFHPLPDYRYRFSAFRLGEIAMLPTEPPMPVKTSTVPSPAIIPVTTHHHENHEVSPEELEAYLKNHPDAYVPPGYGKDRSDWISRGAYPGVDYQRQRDYFRPSNYYNSYMHQPYKSKLWSADSDDYLQRNYYRAGRSSSGAVDYELEEEEDRFNISHHRDWEHYYHYRERRQLYHTLENGIGNKFDFPMKSCIMRAICEAQNLLLPPGKSMVMDIARIVFSVPLKDELGDDYSAAMRERNLDCHEVYEERCPISILQLVLFGKFVS
ncbi:uncharacterized protein LOC131680556 [Topomyia yanbarensis]|uniref:uncharacterized protein LOC131680556 n=1 Tax=Topomyia yanbarensis TaxID=2498891 RepID=UPI00273BF205|nr:uncharacterized protein LOC131680556 [Topomyia yanbarensis]